MSHRIDYICTSVLVMLLAISFSIGAQAQPPALTMSINHEDGGKKGKRHVKKLVQALEKHGCSTTAWKETDSNSPDLIFNPHPVSEMAESMPGHELIAQAKTLQGELSVRGAIMVHASTGINQLSTLKGERISFVGKQSAIGYRMPAELLAEAGITEQPHTFIYVDNHAGAVSALLHSDVFVAVAAEPLARAWAEANDLTLVAITDAVETGGWWLKKSVSEQQRQACKAALGKLKKSEHKTLPGWIDGFKVIVQ